MPQEAQMNYSRVFAIGLSFILPLSAASAQSDSLTSSNIPTPKWEFSLGADPTHFDLNTRDPGVDLRMVGTLTRSWQSPGSRFSRQLSLMVGGDAPHSASPICLGCPGPKRFAGVTAGASADLFHLGRFAPYLHGGAGLYYSHTGAGISSVGDAVFPQRARNDFSLGINGGLGIKARLFSHELFIDQTLHAFDIGAIDRGVYPLSFGIKW